MATCRITVEIELAAPPEVVWADLSDISSHVEWMADAESIEFIDDQRSGVGTAFDCLTKVGPLKTTDRMTITEWEPEHRMGVRHSGLIVGEGAFTLTPGGTADAPTTQFDWTEAIDFPIHLGGPIPAFTAKPILRWIWRRNLTRLAARFED